MLRKFISAGLSVIAMGCATQQPTSFSLGNFLSAKELPYDSPAQVIYRIDNHRYVTLEHYRDCNHGETFYNDTKIGIRSYLGRGTIENFQGGLVNADPSGRNLVFAAATPPHTACSDHGCNPTMAYSTDYGKTFFGKAYFEHSFAPFLDSKKYVIAVDSERVYVAKIRPTDADVTSYPLISGFVYGDKNPLPDGMGIKFDTTMPSGLRTPSGQDHITCDASIKPTNPDAPLVRDH